MLYPSKPKFGAHLELSFLRQLSLLLFTEMEQTHLSSLIIHLNDLLLTP
ncbi:hypothetical protein MtrunA17_Chr1g0167621 [Medicago truncatula]|uniref:Uncharacterized protein n=1 Tax=Medicago truncatula TaxID=3880 RepID=A0A396JPI6_MEDTR|nr:hypothetical protein MtrunA17_Chr1g0167621 [Medicago truncatula]